MGNDLLGDEGLGVHVARALLAEWESLPAGVEVLEAGVSLFDAAPEMARFERVILVDAIGAGGDPGTIYRLDPLEGPDDLVSGSEPMSLHQWSVVETLRAVGLLGLLPPRLALVGAEPGCVEPSLGLSPALERARDRIVADLIDEIRSRTVPARPPG